MVIERYKEALTYYETDIKVSRYPLRASWLTALMGFFAEGFYVFELVTIVLNCRFWIANNFSQSSHGEVPYYPTFHLLYVFSSSIISWKCDHLARYYSNFPKSSPARFVHKFSTARLRAVLSLPTFVIPLIRYTVQKPSLAVNALIHLAKGRSIIMEPPSYNHYRYMHNILSFSVSFVLDVQNPETW